MKKILKHFGKKTLATILCTLMIFSTLFVGSISTTSALNCTGGYIFFDASGWDTTTNSNVQFVIGHSSYSSTYTMTKLNNTNLYYYRMSNWDGATYIAFISTPSKWGDGSWGSSNLVNAQCYTGTLSYDLYGGSTYLFTKSGTAAKGAELIGTYYSEGYSALNLIQTTEVQVSEDGFTYKAADSSPADISISSYRLTSALNITTSSSSAIDKGSVSVINTDVLAAYSASAVYSVGNVEADYEFVGWYDSDTLLSSNTTYERTGITSANTVFARFKKLSQEASIKIDDYTIGNTWIKPNESTDVTIVMKKSHDQSGLSVSYKAQAYGYDAEGNLAFSSPMSAPVDEDNKGKKITFDPVEISYDVEGVYEITVAIFGYDAEGQQVAYGYLADTGRMLTISNDPAKVTLTARLTVTTDSGVTIEEGASGNIIRGETVILNGYCNNGNKPAGQYGENVATSYQYDYYYYTDDVNNSTLIETIIDYDVNLEGKPISKTTSSFTVPESAKIGTKYHFYVEITAFIDGEPISYPCSSLDRGIVTGIVFEQEAITPDWAEGYVYFHTIGDNISDSEAWTTMEVYKSTKNGTISVGTYSSSAIQQVFLPENAKNSDDTYLVYNNYSAEVTFTNGKDKVTVQKGETARIPADSNGLYLGTSVNLAKLNIYTSKAEESVYVNTDAETQDVNKNIVSTVSGLVNALCFNKTGGSKADAVVKNPNITLVQSDGTIDISEVSKQIKGRGNTTWSNTQKKSFNFTLNTKVKVNGMAKDKKYSLLANFQDPSLSRNRFILDLADSVGVPYAADSRYADFYVNGLYAGSYLLTQKNDSIESDLKDDPAEPGTIEVDESGNVTNMDFMIELACYSQGDDLEIKPFNGTTGDGILSVALPDPSDIDDAIADGALKCTKEAIVKFIKTKYETLFTALSDNSTTREELEALIDVESLAKVYLIQELSKNYDAGVSSFYICYVDGKFKASPVWDFDNSLGNCNVSPSEAPDYKQPSGWWCKYWLGNGNRYTKNFVHAAANSPVVLKAAKAAWFGKSSTDKKSFIYNINKFYNDTSTTAKLSADSGLQSKAYYLSVLKNSAENNYIKWSIVPNDWVSGHTSLTMYILDYESLLPIVDYDTYTLAEGYTSESKEFTDTLTKTTYNFTQSAITASNPKGGGQYEFAADYMFSRTAWMTYTFLAGTSYYLTGDFNSWTTEADNDFRLVEIEPDSGIYVIRNLNRNLVCGDNVYFKLNNGSSYIGPEVNTDLSEIFEYNGRTAYRTTGTVAVRDAYASLTANKVPSSWTKVNVYYQPSTGSVWIAQYVLD